MQLIDVSLPLFLSLNNKSFKKEYTYFKPLILYFKQKFRLKKDFIYLFSERGKGKEKEREKNINVWLPLVVPHLGTWPTTQACVLTGNWTGDPLVHRPALNPLSHTRQDWFSIKYVIKIWKLNVKTLLSPWETVFMTWWGRHIPELLLRASLPTCLLRWDSLETDPDFESFGLRFIGKCSWYICL